MIGLCWAIISDTSEVSYREKSGTRNHMDKKTFMALLVAGGFFINNAYSADLVVSAVSEEDQDGGSFLSSDLKRASSGGDEGLAIDVQTWTFFVSLPDANRATNSFPVARDSLMAGLKLGGAFNARGRLTPTGIEIKGHFAAGDVTTSTSANLWRFELNPEAPFGKEYGNRGYAPVVIQGIGGKISLNRISWRVVGGVFTGQRSLAPYAYHPKTRVGINSGPDGKLWTPDDTNITSGDGSQLVDAIAYIGASLSSPNAGDEGDLETISAYLVGGKPVTVEYVVDLGRPVVNQTRAMVYDDVPDSEFGWMIIPTPYGRLFSLSAREGERFEIRQTESLPRFSEVVVESAVSGFSQPEFIPAGNRPMLFLNKQLLE